MNLKQHIQSEIKSQLSESGTTNITESAMSDLDLMAQEAKDLKSFLKDVYKEYKNLPKNRETIIWLDDLYKQSISESVVNEGAMSDLDIMAQDAKDFKEFAKDAYKEFKTLDRNKASLEWLTDIYTQATNESVVNEGKYDFMRGLPAKINNKDYTILNVDTDGFVDVKDSRQNKTTFKLDKIVKSNPGIDKKPKVVRKLNPNWNKYKVVKYNKRMYDKWLRDVASNGGANNAYDMAQNAKNEPGLIDWAKKEFRGEDTMQRIQWDIEAFSESVNEGSDWNSIVGVIGKAIKKAKVPMSYANSYVKSLEQMVKKNSKQFFADYGDFTEDDFIEDVEYNMANESVVTEGKLEEKLITFSNRAAYGQVVFMAGGAGSGKGFAVDSFIDAAGFKVRDVDEMKTAVGNLDKLGKLSIEKWYKKYSKNLKEKELAHVDTYVKDRKLTLAQLASNLKNPNNVSALHFIVDAMGLKDKWVTNMLMGKTNKEVLPNLLFDITAKKVASITDVLKPLLKAGYDSKNIHLIWVLTNYSIAVNNNATRDRMVPDDTMLSTHEGASQTLWQMLTKALPKGVNGRIDVILNNRENTIFYNKDGSANKKAKKDGGIDKRSDVVRTQTITTQSKDDNGKTVTKRKLEKVKFVADFLSLSVKKQGGGITPEGVWKKTLFSWIEKNAPKTTDLAKDLKS